MFLALAFEREQERLRQAAEATSNTTCNLQRVSVLVCVSLAPRSQNVLGGCFGLLGVLALVVTLV